MKQEILLLSSLKIERRESPYFDDRLEGDVD